jgi:hypothetical protein
LLLGFVLAFVLYFRRDLPGVAWSQEATPVRRAAMATNADDIREGATENIKCGRLRNTWPITGNALVAAKEA